MRKLLFTLTSIAALTCAAFAQDRIKLSASYLNTEFQANPLESIEYLKGYSVDADARIYGKGGFRLGGVFNYQKTYNQTVFHDYDDGMEMGLVDIQRNVDTYALGVQLSYRAGPVEPFGAFLLGARKLHEDFSYEVVRKYRAGLDVPFHKESNFFVRPFFVEFEVTGGFNGYRTHKYGAGAGVRF
jgi:hypothetical protein